jgi:type II secretory ATPase GspE/PulE/Tfp pilus assembly ATPase PilB-like protein
MTKLEMKIREAETCLEMGLFDESLSIYKTLMEQTGSSDVLPKSEIKDKIQEIETRIRNERDSVPQASITREMVHLLEDPTDMDTSVGLVDKAAAFKELGLFKEATEVYLQLLEAASGSEEISLPDIFADLSLCLLQIHSPETVVSQILNTLERLGTPPGPTAQSLYRVALEMEKIKALDLSADLFRKALDLDPTNETIRSRVNVSSTRKTAVSRYEHLIADGVTNKHDLQAAFTASRKIGKSIESVLIGNFKVEKEKLGQSLARFYGCPFVAFDPKLPIPVELIQKLKKPFLVHNGWVPLSWNKNGIEVLIDDPKDLRKTDTIRALMATSKFRLSVGTKEDIIRFIEFFFNTDDESALENTLSDLESMLPDVEFEEVEEEEADEEVVDESSSQVVKFVDQVLITAYRKNVSDIHIEPSPLSNITTVRFRQDGVCHEYAQAPNAMAPAILSRIKIMANLDIAEKRLPQDGKIKMNRKGVPMFELRVSTMPTTAKKEDVVLRILAKAGAMALGDLGLKERNQRILEKIITQPYGLILVVGPTGSGKTTTLHSALGHINKPEIKIWTAEDPVEITQAGLRQVEAKPRIGLDFARIMRGFLRLDPDVIMIGEMRDHETAAIGVEASLTGHLVFSTLHTNSAPETITRLLDMGLNPLNFSDAFLGVLAQRLLRKMCKDCKESYHPTEQEFEAIVNAYGKDQFGAVDIAYYPELKLYRSKGCDTCSDSGYRGRMGIHELMEGTREAKGLIKQNSPTEKLFEQAFRDGMATLKQDAIAKMFDGLTDMNEIRRVCVE